jgi:hypothetical protein
MNIIKRSSWDESFFQEFLEFRNEIHKDIPTSFVEKISDYAKYFSPSSVFANDYIWTAFIVRKDHKVVGKCIVSWRNGTDIANLGFIDFINDLEVVKFMLNEVENTSRNAGMKQIKTPVDLNFFIKYRMKTEGGGAPFFGEPIYPDYYHEILKKLNYQIVGRWDTRRVSKLSNAITFAKKRKKLRDKKIEYQGKITVRGINLRNWDTELRIVYDLFLKSFSDMSEYQPITFEQFKIVYDDFKYLINPKIALIVELDGKPVGFNINYVDPLKILKSVENRDLNIIQKAILMLRLQTNLSCMLIAYVGKISGPHGEDIQGVQYLTSKKAWKWGMLMRKVLVCYQSSDSPSRRAWESNKLTPYAEYVLYGKDL